MREYTKKPENQSRTLDSNPRASRQAPISEILQTYKNKTLGRQPIQRESVEDEDLLQTKMSEQVPTSVIFQQYKNGIQRYASEEDEKLLQGKFDTAQREEIDEDELLQGKFDSTSTTEQELVQQDEKTNNTGLPNNLKTGIENLSGYTMDDVKVHYNSDKPAQLQALAYTQGTDIHVGPGQEKHLPHEAWHVVQQKQGKVHSTMQLQGVNVNDDEKLEKEADIMGENIVYHKYDVIKPVKLPTIKSEVTQRVKGIHVGTHVIANSKIGIVSAIGTDNYTINFPASSETVSEVEVTPMYPSIDKSQATLNSIMTNGALSPKELSEKGISVGVTTDDAKMPGYSQKTDICVYTFTLPNKPNISDPAKGPLSVGLENSSVPKLPFGIPISGLMDASGKIDAINSEMGKLSLILKPIFEERLKRTILILSSVLDDSKVANGEDRVSKIPKEKFKFVFKPSTLEYSGSGSESIVNVGLKPINIKIPSFYYIDMPEAIKTKTLDYTDLMVPDYENELNDKLKSLPDFTKCHIYIARL